jgi:hypothetical protein
MAKFGPFTNAALKINLVDLSNRVESVSLELAKDDVDVTAMGDGGHTHMGGLENDKLTVNFWQDFAASEVDTTLLPVFQNGTAVAFKLTANGTSVSSTNPVYSGSVLLTDYAPIAGKVGDGLQSAVSFVVSGTVTEGTSGAW